MKYSPYSFSRLSTHKQCPRKFKYNYIDKVKPEKTDMTALFKGGAVHSILEHYPEQTTHKLAPKYQHIADKFIQSNMGDKYLSHDSIREFDFGLLSDLTPTKYSDKNAIFRGSVDYICTIDNVINLIDYKTGKYKEQKWQVYDQLMFYAIYFFYRYPSVNEVRISYVYVEHELENDLVLKREHLEQYTSELFDLINNVETDETFIKKPTRLCEWCNFKTHCSNDIV